MEMLFRPFPASWGRGGIELEENILAHVTTKEDIISFNKTLGAFFNVVTGDAS